jgi:hypothetical protein
MAERSARQRRAQPSGRTADTSALFLYLWGADANLAVSGGRGGSAAADYAANKTIALPDWRGRALAGLDDMGNSAAGRLDCELFFLARGGAESRLHSNRHHVYRHCAVTSTVTVVQNATTVSINSTGSGAFGYSSIPANAVLTASGTASVTSNNTTGNAHATASPMMLATIYLKL